MVDKITAKPFKFYVLRGSTAADDAASLLIRWSIWICCLVVDHAAEKLLGCYVSRCGTVVGEASFLSGRWFISTRSRLTLSGSFYLFYSKQSKREDSVLGHQTSRVDGCSWFLRCALCLFKRHNDAESFLLDL